MWNEVNPKLYSEIIFLISSTKRFLMVLELLVLVDNAINITIIIRHELISIGNNLVLSKYNFCIHFI